MGIPYVTVRPFQTQTANRKPHILYGLASKICGFTFQTRPQTANLPKKYAVGPAATLYGLHIASTLYFGTNFHCGNIAESHLTSLVHTGRIGPPIAEIGSKVRIGHHCGAHTPRGALQKKNVTKKTKKD